MFFFRKTQIDPIGVLGLCAIFLSPLAATFTQAAETTQSKAQQEAEELHRKAADLSMQNSTTSAMTALMDLAALNIGGAVSNGYKAYGSYRNSEELDVTADLDNYLKNKMISSGTAFNGGTQSTKASATAKGSGGISGLTITDTSFSRLNPSFLRTGDSARVAAEFEKKSGMSREEFLTNLGKISDNKLSANDPQLMDKMVGRFEAFIAKIPNQEFRGNLEKGIAMIPQSARTGLVAQALQKLSSGFMTASSSGGSGISDHALAKTEKLDSAPNTKPVTTANTATSVVAAATVPAEKSAGAAARAPSSNNAGEKIENAGFFIGLEKEGNDPLGNIIQSAMESQSREETIFSQVTRRYRIVTPLLSRTP